MNYHSFILEFTNRKPFPLKKNQLKNKQIKDLQI